MAGLGLQIGACIVFVWHAITIAIVQAPVFICIKRGRCCYVWTRIVNVHDAVPVVVHVVGRIALNALHDQGKTHGIAVQTGRALSTTRLDKSSDDIDIEIRGTVEITLRDIESKNGFV